MVGQPDHRRTHLLQAALKRRGLAPARIVDYTTLLDEPQRFADAVSGSVVVKLDSPGESAALHDALLHRGWIRNGEQGPPPKPLAHAELANQHLWYAGFAGLLQTLHRVAGDARWLNPPGDILRMCDKWRCQQDLIAAGVVAPPLLGLIDGYDALRRLSEQHDCDRIFVKARYGSSAAGVLAYRHHRDGREVAYASTSIIEGAKDPHLFNTLAPKRYTDRRSIAALIDALAIQGAYVERWIAKPRAPGHAGHHFDLRVVAFEGEPRQRVARIADRPMTNLHLGNRRGDPQALLDATETSVIEDRVRKAAAVFAKSAMIGFDLIPGREACHVLEANAFGDLLPGLRWHGADAYDDQAAWVAGHDEQDRNAA
ncbi:MAG: STM4014 family protein [Lysobacter sp.]|nr:STM4014 family protein [Lysobacter sp.]